MTMNQKPTGTAMSMPAGLAVGGVWSLAITIVLSALIAKLIDGGAVAQGSIGYFVISILLIASITGALQSFRKIKRRRMLVCLISGLIYFCVLLTITALCFGGQYQGIGVTALVVLCGSCCAGLMGLREKKQGRKGKIPALHR
ncbi:MAG: TIGR04086 family membrane protein [Oscillospiraceae bacterium]|nr:TIGR04086 family membrane protein [Oscillospiraceae bacterium]